MDETVDNLTEEHLAEHLNEEFTETVLPVIIFVGLEIFLGFFGNLIVLYVYLFHYHVCNFRYFVLSLAFVDILSTLTTMPGEIVTLLNWYVYTLREVCKVKSFLNVFTAYVEALCLLAIAFDRYRKVCRPFKWQIKPRTSIYICCAIYIIAFFVSLPDPFMWGLQYSQIEYKNTVISVTRCEKDERFKNTVYPLIYVLSLEAVLSVCLFAMLVLYFFIAKTLTKQKRGLKNSRIPEVDETKQRDNSPALHVYAAGSTGTAASDTIDCCSIEAANAIGIKNDVVTSDVESETQKTSSNLKVSSDCNRDVKPVDNDEKEYSHEKAREPREKKTISERVRRKTLMMFILTLTFIATMLLYMTLLSFIAESDNILQKIDKTGKAVYFFFFRLYFLNHVINPVVYGLLDPTFRKAARKAFSINRHNR